MARYLCSFSHIASGFVNELSRRTHLYFSTHLVAEMNVSFLKSNVAIRYAVALTLISKFCTCQFKLFFVVLLSVGCDVMVSQQ